MATNESTSQDTVDKTGSSLLARLQILVVVVAIVLGECLAAYWYLPSPTETAAMAGGTLGISEPVEKEEAAEEDFFDDSELGDQVEVDLGEFSVTSFQPISNTTLRIDFHLFGTVAADDEQEFRTLIEENAHRFREQVIVTVRASDINDLTDAGLGLLKRQILEKTNKVLGKNLLRVVIFSDFSFIEQ